MSDAINPGCTRTPPSGISGSPPVNSADGFAPNPTRIQAPTVAKAKSRARQMFQQLGLSSSTRSALLKAMGLKGSGNRAAGAKAKAGFAMLESLSKAVTGNPKLSSSERNQFASQWIKLGKRATAQDVFTALSKSKQFWNRLQPRHRKMVAKHLETTAATPAETAKDMSQIIGHHLFGSANAVGKHNALADICDTKKLLKASTLVDAGKLKQQAKKLMMKHLGKTKPKARAILHKQVMKTAKALQKSFFQYQKGKNKLLGDRFVNAFGSDWYKQCLSLILNNASRNACLSAYNLMGVHKGADKVCRSR